MQLAKCLIDQSRGYLGGGKEETRLVFRRDTQEYPPDVCLKNSFNVNY